MHLILCIIGTIRRANATAKGYPAWYIRGVFLNKDEWMDEYHIRSVVESVFSSIRRCLVPILKGWLKRRELAIKVLAYNIKIYIKMAKDLGITLWVSQFQALVSWITLIEVFPFSLKEVLMLPINFSTP